MLGSVNVKEKKITVLSKMKASSLEFSSNIKKKLHICVKQKKKQQQENPAVKETIAEGILI